MKYVKLWAVLTLLGVNINISAQFMNVDYDSRSESIENSGGWSALSVQYNPSTFMVDVSGSENKKFTAFSMEFTNAFGLTQSVPFFLEWGIGVQYGFYSDSGYLLHNREFESEFSMFTIPVPFNLVFDIRIPNSFISIDPYLGIKFRGIILAQEKYKISAYGKKEEEETYSYFDKDDVGSDGKWNRFQVGWQAGLNLRFNNIILLGISYGSDLTEVADKLKIRQLSAKIGVVF